MFILYLLLSTQHVTLNLIECLAELWLVFNNYG